MDDILSWEIDKDDMYDVLHIQKEGTDNHKYRTTGFPLDAKATQKEMDQISLLLVQAQVDVCMCHLNKDEDEDGWYS